MVNINVKRVRRDRLAREIDDYVVSGWQLKSQNDNMAIMIKRGWGSGPGHLFIFLYTFWWTVGLGNMIYALHAHYMGGAETHIKVDD
jgi:hypothetical protein